MDDLVERYRLECELWRREHTGEWVLEISGGIGDTYLCSRHTEPLTTAADDAVGLPSLYSAIEALTAERDRLKAALTRSAELCPQCDGAGEYDFGPSRNKRTVPCEFCEITRNALATQENTDD